MAKSPKNEIKPGDMITGRDEKGNIITGEFMGVVQKTGPKFRAEGTEENSLVIRQSSGKEVKIDRTKGGPFKRVK